MSDELLSFLVDCFPEADFELLAHAACVNRTREEAFDFVLALNVTPEPPNVCPTQTLLAQLVEVFPEVNVEILTKFVNFRPKDQGLEELIDEVMVRLGTFEGKPLDDDRTPLKSKPERRRLSIGKLSFQSDSYRDQIETTQFEQSRAPFVYRKFAGLEAPSAWDMETTELRAEIARLGTEKRALYSKASESFSRSGFTGTQSAVYYSDKAKALDSEIEHLKLEASYRIFLKYNDDQSSKTLDMHHLTLDEAIPIMDAWLEHHVGDKIKLPEPLKIITGAGKHSAVETGPRLRPAVWRRLGFSQYVFNYDGHAVFTVFGKQGPNRVRNF